jgi:hypothetical protein
LDLKILMELDDRDLIQTCATNKELYRICNADQSFWRNRYVKQYGEFAAKYKPEERSWKNRYMQTYIDLHKFPNPIDFLSHIAWKENIDKSYFVDYDNTEIRELKSAPEWVMNNLYLLKIPNIQVVSFAPNALLLAASNVYENITPFELFSKIAAPENLYILDFRRMRDNFIPNFVSRDQLETLFSLDEF